VVALQGSRLNIGLTVALRSVFLAALSLLTACATRLDPAPIVDLSNTSGGTAIQQALRLAPPPPGYYRVKPGDTLSRIAIENGQNDRDLVTWNNLANPNQIEVNQLLRVVPPGASTTTSTAGVSTTAITGSGVQTTQLGCAEGSVQVPMQTDTGEVPAGTSSAIALAWPVHGPLLSGFDDTNNKGIDIGGAAGDPVRAAAGGRVVYAGNGLRGYGNLLIVKDDATFLTAYAHNRALIVREGDTITKGQKIAEMGNTDSDHVMLHFELRREGKPVDPLKYLPPQ
jgi:lipoprotein NlpD